MSFFTLYGSLSSAKLNFHPAIQFKHIFTFFNFSNFEKLELFISFEGPREWSQFFHFILSVSFEEVEKVTILHKNMSLAMPCEACWYIWWKIEIFLAPFHTGYIKKSNWPFRGSNWVKSLRSYKGQSLFKWPSSLQGYPEQTMDVELTVNVQLRWLWMIFIVIDRVELQVSVNLRSKPDNLDLPSTLTLATVNRRLEVNQIYNDSIRSRFAQIEQKPKRKHGDHFILVKMSNEK